MRLKDGKVLINNNEIFKGMKSDNFKNIFSSEVNSYANGEMERYNFKNPQIIDGLAFRVGIVFKKNSISSIELKNADPKLKNSYENWSDDNVELKRKSHDEWLINQLGQPDERKPAGIEYHYTWGHVISYYDSRGGDTGIRLNYYTELHKIKDTSHKNW